MTTRIAFLRAVNLGTRKVRNSRLVELLEELGYHDVWTYINSGNVVFTATGSRAALEHAIGTAVARDVGFEATTFVRTAAELRNILAVQPFALRSGDTYFVTFLADGPNAAQRKRLESLSTDFDTLKVVGREVHWLMGGKSTDSKLVKRHWEQILGPNSSTSRNTTMLTKLLGKVSAR